MSNMEPGRNPPRYQRQPVRQAVNYTGWIIAAIAVLAVIAAIAYGMRTVSTSTPSPTTGQSNPAPGAPQPGPPVTNR